jgi:hypothetical protein
MKEGGLVFFCWEEEEEAQSVVMYDSKELFVGSCVIFCCVFLFSFFCILDLQESFSAVLCVCARARVFACCWKFSRSSSQTVVRLVVPVSLEMLELLANSSSSQNFGLVGMCRETEIETDRQRHRQTHRRS